MATFNGNIFIDGSIKVAQTGPITFTVPTDRVFKGTISSRYLPALSNASGVLHIDVELRLNNVSGAIIASHSNMTAPYNTYNPAGENFSVCTQVELPAGTYYLSGIFSTYIVGGAGTPFSAAASSLGVVGTLYGSNP